MVWQDIAITIATIVFSCALIPQVYKGFKEKRGVIALQTALLTTLGLYTIAISFAALNLMFSALANTINGTLWAILLLQGVIWPDKRH